MLRELKKNTLAFNLACSALGLESLSKGVYETYNLSSKTLMFVGKMVTGDLGTQNLSGPIGIVKMSGDHC